jgi:ferritin-like metal-binding protein YciE
MSVVSNVAEMMHAPASDEVIKHSLGEEVAMAMWIDSNLKETIGTFVHRSEAGEKAGL